MSGGHAVEPLVDLSALSFWAQTPEEREAAFAVLRAESPVSWQRPAEGSLMPQDEDDRSGYWAVVRYEDVRSASRDPETFCSGRGVMFEDVPEELLEASQSFLAMDDPRHKKLRGLVSAGFSPRQVRLIEEGIREDARAIVEDLGDRETGDFVELVAKRLPLMTIMRMLGVPGVRPRTAGALRGRRGLLERPRVPPRASSARGDGRGDGRAARGRERAGRAAQGHAGR